MAAVFATILGLTVLSSLPIHVSYVMPDVFTGLAVVMSFVAVLSWQARSPMGKVLDVAVMTALMAVHLSHLPISIALIFIYGLGAIVLHREVRPVAILGGLVLPFAITIALLVGSNMAVARRPVISESSPLFLLARLVGDGPAVSYLTEHCGRETYLLCADLSRLTGEAPGESGSDYFLWSPQGAVKHIASPRLLTEAAKIDSATIKEFPVQIASNALRNGLRQLVSFQIDSDIQIVPPPFILDAVGDIDPRLVGPFLKSPVARGQFPLGAARLVIAVGVIMSVVAIAALALALRSQLDSKAWMFMLIVAAGILANALATGGLSEVHDRYGNRVIWLLPLTAMTLAAIALQRRSSTNKSPAQA